MKRTKIWYHTPCSCTKYKSKIVHPRTSLSNADNISWFPDVMRKGRHILSAANPIFRVDLSNFFSKVCFICLPFCFNFLSFLLVHFLHPFCCCTFALFRPTVPNFGLLPKFHQNSQELGLPGSCFYWQKKKTVWTSLKAWNFKTSEKWQRREIFQ